MTEELDELDKLIELAKIGKVIDGDYDFFDQGKRKILVDGSTEFILFTNKFNIFPVQAVSAVCLLASLFCIKEAPLFFIASISLFLFIIYSSFTYTYINSYWINNSKIKINSRKVRQLLKICRQNKLKKNKEEKSDAEKIFSRRVSNYYDRFEKEINESKEVERNLLEEIKTHSEYKDLQTEEKDLLEKLFNNKKHYLKTSQELIQ